MAVIQVKRGDIQPQFVKYKIVSFFLLFTLLYMVYYSWA